MKKIKNSTLLMAAGGLFLVVGIVLLITQKHNTYVAPTPSEVLSQEEAVALINDTTNRIIEIYENPTATFTIVEPKKIEKDEPTEEPKEDTEEVKKENEELPVKEEVVEDPHPGYYEVSDYDKVIDAIFTENGKKELEATKFDDKEFVIKDEDGRVFILKEIPSENRYKGNNSSVGTTKILKESITSELTITAYGLDEDMLTYYVILKNIQLVKKDNEWLVDSFYYTNK